MHIYIYIYIYVVLPEMVAHLLLPPGLVGPDHGLLYGPLTLAGADHVDVRLGWPRRLAADRNSGHLGIGSSRSNGRIRESAVSRPGLTSLRESRRTELEERGTVNISLAGLSLPIVRVTCATRHVHRHVCDAHMSHMSHVH